MNLLDITKILTVLMGLIPKEYYNLVIKMIFDLLLQLAKQTDNTIDDQLIERYIKMVKNTNNLGDI